MHDVPQFGLPHTQGDITSVGIHKKEDKTGLSQMPSHTPEVDEQISIVAIGRFTIDECGGAGLFDCSNLTFDMLSIDQNPELELTQNESSAQQILATNVNMVGIDQIMDVAPKHPEMNYFDLGDNAEQYTDYSVYLNKQAAVGSLQELSENIKVAVLSKETGEFTFKNIDSTNIRDAMNNPNAFVVSGQNVYYREHQKDFIEEHVSAFRQQFGQDIQFIAVSQDQWFAIVDIIDQALQSIESKENEAISEEKHAEQSTSPNNKRYSATIRHEERGEDTAKQDNTLVYTVQSTNKSSIGISEREAKERKHKREEEANREAREIERSEIRKQENKAEIRKEEIKKKMKK